MATESTEFGTGKTLIVLTVVIGCFAVLWPKIFYPAFQETSPSSKKHEGKPVCLPCAIKFEEEKKLQFHYELCNLIVKDDKEYRNKPRPASLMFRLCRETVLQACHLELDDSVVHKLQKSIEENVTTSGTANLTTCLLAEFRIDGHHIVLALHKKNASTTKQIHQERPPHLRPEMMHPALREKGQNIPPRMRTIERDARPGPMPGMRPTIGGPGHVVQSNKQASTMSIVMPIYTLVIVLFFIYTITKVLFKKNQDSTPKVMDFHMDPEQRKFVFSEEYSDADPYSMKSYLRKQERDQKRQDTEKENSKIVIDAIEGIVKEIDEYKAQKAEEDKKEPLVQTSRLVEHEEGETEDAEEETVALSRDQTQQVETSTGTNESQGAKEAMGNGKLGTIPGEVIVVEKEEVCQKIVVKQSGDEDTVKEELMSEDTPIKPSLSQEIPMKEPVSEYTSLEPVSRDISIKDSVSLVTPLENPASRNIPIEEQACLDTPIEEQACLDTPIEEQVCPDTLLEENVCPDTRIEEPVCEDIANERPICKDVSIKEAVCEHIFIEESVSNQTLVKESVSKDDEHSEEPPVKEETCHKIQDSKNGLQEESTLQEAKEDDEGKVVSCQLSWLQPETVEVNKLLTESTIKETDLNKSSTESQSLTETIKETVEHTEDTNDMICQESRQESDALVEVAKSVGAPDETIKSVVYGTNLPVSEVKPKQITIDVADETEHIPEERVDETTPTPDGGEYEEVEVVVGPQVRELEVLDDGSILSYILDGSVASDMQLLVSEAQCEALSLEECHLNDPTSDYADISDPVVISGKMTISFIEGTTLSSLSELPDLSLDASQSRGLAITALDEDSSMYAELPLDEPTTKESTPEEEVLADIARQIEELENAMKEVQEAAGVLKEEVEAKDSEAENKSATEDEEEDVSEYKSVRVEEVSTADDYVSTAHQASHLSNDGTDQSRAPPYQTQSLQKADNKVLHQEHQQEAEAFLVEEEGILPVKEDHQQEVSVKEERVSEEQKLPIESNQYEAVESMPSVRSELHPELLEAFNEQLEESTQPLNQQKEAFLEADELSETDSNLPVLSVLYVDQNSVQETPEGHKTDYCTLSVDEFNQGETIVEMKTEPMETEEFVIYPDTLSEEAREYVLQLSVITVNEAVHEAQCIVDQMQEEERSETDGQHSASYANQEALDQMQEDKLNQTDCAHSVLSVQYEGHKLLEQTHEEDNLSQTDSENPVLSVQYVNQELIDQMPEEDKLSQMDSQNPVVSVQCVNQELSNQMPEEDKLSQTDSENPVLSVQYVDQELSDIMSEEGKLNQTDSENPVLSVEYVNQELLDKMPEEDKLSQTDSENPVLSVQYVDQELSDQMYEKDKLSRTDSENPVLSVEYVDQKLLDQMSEKGQLRQTDSKNSILSVEYVNQEVSDEMPEEDKLSQTDSENPVLSVQYVDQELLDQIPEEEKLSQTDSEQPVLSIQYVDQVIFDSIPEEDKLNQISSGPPVFSVQYVNELGNSQAPNDRKHEEAIVATKPSREQTEESGDEEFFLYPDTLSEDARVYVQDIAALTVKSAIAEAQRQVAEEQAVQEALAEAMREERSPSPTDMIEYYSRSRSGTPVDAAAVIIHDAAPQSAVVRPQQVTDLKHKAFDSRNEQPEEKSSSPSEMVGNNGGSTSSLENVSKNEEEVKTELGADA